MTDTPAPVSAMTLSDIEGLKGPGPMVWTPIGDEPLEKAQKWYLPAILRWIAQNMQSLRDTSGSFASQTLESAASSMEYAARTRRELEDKAQALQSRQAKLVEALEKGAAWFRDYERQHLAKRTCDGDLKADTNAERAAFLETALTDHMEAGNGQ